MKTIHLYLTRQVLSTVVMTVAVFTFVLLLANVLKEILALLVNRQVTLLLAVKAIALLIPFVLVFALPMGMLTAALLVFGRFSADHELTAVRVGGVSLIALVGPILLISCAMSGVCALINMQVAPQCRVAYKHLLFAVATSRTGLLLPEKTFIKDFPNHIIYIGKVDGSNLADILIYKLEADKVESYIRASEGRMEADPTNQVIHVQLIDAWQVGLTEDKRTSLPLGYAAELPFTYTNKPPDETQEKIKLTDMTFFQLRDEMHDLERRIRRQRFAPKMSKEELETRLRQLQRERGDITLPVRVQMHRQVAFSFACIGFTLVGIPLGIRAHRRETTFGIAVALILVLLYYSFFIFAQTMDTRPEYSPHLILWLPNFIFQAVGAVLLWRANRGI